MVDERVLIYHEGAPPVEFNLVEEDDDDYDSASWHLVDKAKKEAYLVNLFLSVITLGKITSSSLFLSLSFISLTPLTLWVIFMFYYDVMYILHLACASLAIRRCTEDQLLYAEPDTEDN